MYHLLYFPADSSLDVCSSDKVCMKKSSCFVRYKTKWYLGHILFSHESKEYLDTFLDQLTIKPIVPIQKLQDICSSNFTSEIQYIDVPSVHLPSLSSEENLDEDIVLDRSSNSLDIGENYVTPNEETLSLEELCLEEFNYPSVEASLSSGQNLNEEVIVLDDSPNSLGIQENYATPDEQNIVLEDLSIGKVTKKRADSSLVCHTNASEEDCAYYRESFCDEPAHVQNVRDIDEVRKCLFEDFLEGDNSDEEDIDGVSTTSSSQDPVYVPSECSSDSASSVDITESNVELEISTNVPPDLQDTDTHCALTEQLHEDFQMSDPTDFNISADMDNDKNASPQENVSTPFDVIDLIGQNLPLQRTVTNVIPSGSNGKKFFCVFCKKQFSKFARHLESVHKDREEVKKFTALPKGNPERQKIISLIRAAGNYVYNTNTSYNLGDLMVSRRPQLNKERTPDDYVCCPYCRNFFSKLTVKRHVKTCFANHSNSGSKNVLLLGRKICARVSDKASETMKKYIFPYMHEDEIVRSLRYDELAILYGNELCLRYRDEHFQKMIRSEMRLLGRLLLTAKEGDNTIKAVKDLFHPKRFHYVMDAVTKLGKIDVSTQMMKSPSVALHAGTLIRKVAKFYVSMCIQNEEDSNCELTKKFLWLMDTHFNSHISQTAFESRLSMTRKKKIELPSDKDIQKFMFYILDNVKKYYLKLSNAFDESDWRNLASFCLLWTIAFNRRRVGEVERMKIEDFNNYETVDQCTNKDIFNSLSSEGQEAAKKFIRIVLRGKLGRTVPVLLCTLVFRSLQLILKHRKDARVSDGNRYVFGVYNAHRNNHFNACALLREHSVKCGASRPKLLRGTILRKHIATQCVLLNLTDREISDLANYMGHDEKIHKGIYRLPIVAREITQISKILEKAQNIDGSNNSRENLQRRVNREDLQDMVRRENIQNRVSQEDFQDRAELMMPTSSSSYEQSNERMELSKSSDSQDAQSEECVLSENDLSESDSDMLMEDLPLPSSVPYKRKVPWTSLEKSVARQVFKQHLCKGRTPSMRDCFEAVRKHPELSKRSPQALKTWINNQLNKPPTCAANFGRRRWTTPEKRILRTEFQYNYATRKLPSLRQCLEIQQKYRHVFKDRAPQVIKAKLNNEFRKNLKD